MKDKRKSPRRAISRLAKIEVGSLLCGCLVTDISEDGVRLYVEQGVVFETDPAVAREVARAWIDIYCGLPNYVNNWKRLGFTDDDVASRSDRLVDGLIAWGDADAIRDRLDAHRKAGADHVCIQVIHRPGASSREAWRALAP